MKKNEYNREIYEDEHGWWFRIWKPLGGGFTVKTFGGPYRTKEEATLECGWKQNEWESYES